MTTTTESFVADRGMVWKGVGTVVDGAMTYDEAAEMAGLNDWNVEKELISTQSGLIIPKQYATVRQHPIRGVLGIVGERYQIVQNETAFEMLDLIVGQSGAHYDSAGSLKGGRQTFMSLKLPEGILIAGEDAVDLYLMARNSFDGSSSLTFHVSPVRKACYNMVNAAIKGAKRSWGIRHTESVSGRIQEAREALSLTFAYAHDFEEEMEKLLDVSVSDAEWEAFSRSLVPDSKSDAVGWQRRAEEAREALSDLFYSAETNAFGRGTAYAAYNAAVEYADWLKPLKGKDPTGAKRAERTLTSPTIQNFKDRALVLASRLGGAKPATVAMASSATSGRMA